MERRYAFTPDARWRVPLAPDARPDTCADVLELDCRGPLVPRAAAAATAVASLMNDLVLAPAIDVEASLNTRVPSLSVFVATVAVAGLLMIERSFPPWRVKASR